MALFTSSREKQLWLYVVIVVGAIFSTLILGRPFVEILGNQNIQAVIFLLAMLLVATTIIVHGLKRRPGKAEFSIWLGLTAVYMMVFLRLGLPERSHLIEYSVLAIFIHNALSERINHTNRVPLPGLVAFFATFIIGVIDESIQLLLPERVFDPIDILFNGSAALMAIGSVIALQWVGRKFKKD